MTKEDALNVLIKGSYTNDISDGYHTFGELYAHRHALFITLSKIIQQAGNHVVWRSLKQSDGTQYKEWFIMGISSAPGEQISYHLPYSLWDKTRFAQTLEKAPEFDGHTSEDVLERLMKL